MNRRVEARHRRARGAAAALIIWTCIACIPAMAGGAAGASPVPPGADARSLLDGSALPPGSAVGVAPSEPNGASVNPGRGFLFWDGRGPWGGNIKSLVPDPANNARVLCAAGLSAAREAGGIWLSVDGGVSWADTDLGGLVCYMAAASLSEPGVFYAGAYDGLYRSTDSGEHWSRIAFTGQIIGAGVKADDGNVLIAGLSSNQGIRRSTDRGQTWEAVGVNSAYMKGFAVTPVAPERMYMAMSSASSACFRSDDGGASWVPFGPTGTDGWGVWADPADAERIFVSTSSGVYRTLNGGLNWMLVLTGNCYANVSVKDGVVYAPIVANGPSGSGVYESTDGGDSWTNENDGIVASFFYCSAATSAGVLAGHYGGIYRSPQSASPWIVSQTGLDNAYVRSISYYADRGELWAATDQSGLWRSTDDGQTWEMKSAGLGDWALYRLTPRDHEHGQGDRMFVTTYTGIYRSTDYGESWQPVGFSGQFMRGILVDPGNPDRVWTGGAVNQEVWRSEDAGDSWLQVGAGIIFGFYPDFQMGRNAMGQPRLFVNYEQLTNRIYYSDDLGATFTPSTGLESTGYQPSLTLHDADPQVVFCATDVGVYKSVDYGQTFQSSGLTSIVWSLLGTRTNDVYAGRNRYGVYVSGDDGATWEALNTGIETLVIWDLAYGSTTADLFCSPRGHGVRMLTVDTAAAPDLGGNGALARTVPSPFHDRSVLRWGRPLEGWEISIRDLQGRLVRTERQDGAAATGAWSWDGRDQAGRELPAGTYFYEIRSRTGGANGRWVLVR